jgi:glycosyltransferase involved in cell wall biosynthesis
VSRPPSGAADTLPPLRIVHLADYAAPYAGGFGPMMEALRAAVEARGWTFQLIVPEEADDRPWVVAMRERGTTVDVLPRTPRLAVARRVRALLDASEPTVLHTHYAGYDVPAVLAALGRRDVRVIWHIHMRLKDAPAVRVRNTLSFGVLARRVARVLAVAPDAVSDLRRRGSPAARTAFFANGVDTKRFAQRPLSRDQARERLGVPAGVPALLHFSWDWQIKGGDLFVATIAALRREGREVVGLTVGGGDHARAAAERAGVADAVCVLDPTDDVRVLHAAADAFLSTSGSEGMPFAVIEALSGGLATVATDVTEGHVAIGTDLAAYRLAPLDGAAFAREVAELLDRPPEQAERDAAELRERMRAQFDVEPWARRVLALYDELAA